MTTNRWHDLMQEVNQVAKETGDQNLNASCAVIVKGADVAIDILLSPAPSIVEGFQQVRKDTEAVARDVLISIDKAYEKRLQNFDGLLAQLRQSHGLRSSNPPLSVTPAGVSMSQGNNDQQAVAAAKALSALFQQMSVAITTLQNISDAQMEQTGRMLFALIKKYIDGQRSKVKWLLRRLWLVKWLRRSVRGIFDVVTFLILLLVVLLFHDFVARMLHSLAGGELRAFGLIFLAMAVIELAKLFVEGRFEGWMHGKERGDAARDYQDLITVTIRTLEMVARVNAI